MSTRVWKLIFALIGAGMLLYLLASIDLGEVVSQIRLFGILGLTCVVGIYALAFLLDTLSYHLMLPSVPLNAVWQWRVFRVRALGEAVNSATPFGGFGGEPVKAIVLNRRFGISYQEGIASLVLAKTTNLLALLGFLGIGYWLIRADTRITDEYRMVTLAGLTALTVGVVAFFLIQRQRWSSTLSEYLSRKPLGRRLTPVLGDIRSLDDRLRDFYHGTPYRFLSALCLAFSNWMVGTLELMVVFAFLQVPITWTEAWVIEAVAQLVRTGTFFIPASIGAQEGAFVVIVSLLTGNPTAGLACALVRRARELVWIAIGFALGWGFSANELTPTHLNDREPS